MHLKNSIIVPAGFTLTLNSTVYMAPGRKITIKKGGMLLITGQGKITSACTELWGGIEVEGEGSEQIPANQGILVIDAGSVIENAVCAVKTIKASSFSSGSGGIIQATEAIFRNNRTTVSLSPYPGHVTQTQFTKCLFEATEILLDGSNPQQLVYLNGLSNPECVHFKGCSFKTNGIVKYSTGIKSYNSYFACLNSGLTQTTFDNLRCGVYASTDGTVLNSFSIGNCDFINNRGSIYASGIQSIKLLDNDIKVALIYGPNPDNSGSSGVPVPAFPDEFTAYGVYLDACSGYTCENNQIYSDLYNTGPIEECLPCGIYIRNSGAVANEIYRNSLSNLNCGIAAYGINRNGINDGLNLKCNTMFNCATDVGVYRGSLPLSANTGIKRDQGDYNTTDPAKSAGNVFTPLSFQYHTKDIDNSNCMPIRYNHHRTISIPNNLRMIPLAALSPGVAINQNTLSVYSSSESCPPSLGDNHSGSGWVQQADSLIEKAENLEAILLQQVDGGNTAGTAQDVLNSTPDETFSVFTDLLDKSPYLSDTVMKTAVQREDLLTGVMLRNILVANPQSAKSDTVLNALDNRFAPLNDTLMGDIMANETVIGNKEFLEMQKAEALQQYGIALNNRIYSILSDTTLIHAADSLAALCTLSNRLSDKYTLALLYSHNNEPGLAAAILSSIPQQGSTGSFNETEQDVYSTWANLVNRAVANNANITFDSLQINAMFSLIAGDTLCTYTPVVYARNCLVHAGFLNYLEPLEYDLGLKSSKVRKHYPKIASTTVIAGYLKVFPNPANDYIVIKYQLNNGCAEGSIQVFAADGKNLLNIKVSNNRDVVVLPFGNYSGNILITLQGCSGHIDTQKVIVN